MEASEYSWGDGQKYRLDLADTLQYQDYTLFRVVYRDGTKGGWVGGYKNLAQEGSCCVLDNAKVFEDAMVTGDAELWHEAVARGSAKVGGKSFMSECAVIKGHATLGGFAEIHGTCEISGNAIIGGDASICGSTKISGNVTVTESVFLDGECEIDGEGILPCGRYQAGKLTLGDTNQCRRQSPEFAKMVDATMAKAFELAMKKEWF